MIVPIHNPPSPACVQSIPNPAPGSVHKDKHFSPHTRLPSCLSYVLLVVVPPSQWVSPSPARSLVVAVAVVVAMRHFPPLNATPTKHQSTAKQMHHSAQVQSTCIEVCRNRPESSSAFSRALSIKSQNVGGGQDLGGMWFAGCGWDSDTVVGHGTGFNSFSAPIPVEATYPRGYLGPSVAMHCIAAQSKRSWDPAQLGWSGRFVWARH
jgi:hypothetical protein